MHCTGIIILNTEFNTNSLFCHFENKNSQSCQTAWSILACQTQTTNPIWLTTDTYVMVVVSGTNMRKKFSIENEQNVKLKIPIFFKSHLVTYCDHTHFSLLILCTLITVASKLHNSCSHKILNTLLNNHLVTLELILLINNDKF